MIDLYHYRFSVTDFVNMPTRQLLAHYERLRACRDMTCRMPNDPIRCLVESTRPIDESRLSIDELEYFRLLKEELDKREHVPNAIEARELRQQKAKEKRNRGRQN